jgi:hypothetical protein
LSLSSYGIKKIKYPKKQTGFVKCASCKNEVEEYRLKETVVPVGSGWKLRGDCPICKHFCKWIPNKHSQFYGRL